MNERDRLINLYWQKRNTYFRLHNQRIVITILSLSAWYALFVFAITKPDTLLDVLRGIVSSAIIGALHYIINFHLMNFLISAERKEDADLSEILCKIRDIDAKESSQK